MTINNPGHKDVNYAKPFKADGSMPTEKDYVRYALVELTKDQLQHSIRVLKHMLHVAHEHGVVSQYITQAKLELAVYERIWNILND